MHDDVDANMPQITCMSTDRKFFFTLCAILDPLNDWLNEQFTL
jgi:hypothetical protein